MPVSEDRCSPWARLCTQTPDAVLADVTPAERAKYDGHFAKVKRTGGWVDARTARQFFTKAGLPVRAGRRSRHEIRLSSRHQHQFIGQGTRAHAYLTPLPCKHDRVIMDCHLAKVVTAGQA